MEAGILKFKSKSERGAGGGRPFVPCRCRMFAGLLKMYPVAYQNASGTSITASRDEGPYLEVEAHFIQDNMREGRCRMR